MSLDLGTRHQIEVRPDEPKEVFCVIDHAHRDLGVADDVVLGRFTLGGIMVDLGANPDWLGATLPDDDEWRIEWSKFYYGLDLAFAYSNTGDRKYLDSWEGLVKSWITTVPFDHDTVDVVARRIQNWTYAWCRFNDAPGFDGLHDGLGDEIVASISAQLDYLRSNLSAERNHRTLELYAVFICATAFPSLDQNGSKRDRAIFDLYRNVCSDILGDGAHRELSTHYHAIVLRSLVGLRVNAKRFGLGLAEDFDARVEAACEFLAWMIRPDGSLPMLGDSDDGDYSELLRTAAAEFERPDLLYVASKGARGVPPETTTRSFDEAGYHVMRSGWGDRAEPYVDERHLVFDCGPLGASGHCHYDALHIEVAAAGQPLLIDPGRFTYSEHGQTNWRHWFKGTSAHNTLLVDQVDQTPYRRGKPKAPVAHARLVHKAAAPGLLSMTGEVVSPSYDAIHRRRILFVRSSWWIVEDDVRAIDKHSYELRFHLATSAQGKVEIGSDTARAPGLLLSFGPVKELRLTIEQGWVAKTYGVRTPAPVVVAAVEAANVRFRTLIIPTRSAEPGVRWFGERAVEVGRDNVQWDEGSMSVGDAS